jgi:hypothetical protein
VEGRGKLKALPKTFLFGHPPLGPGCGVAEAAGRWRRCGIKGSIVAIDGP